MEEAGPEIAPNCESDAKSMDNRLRGFPAFGHPRRGYDNRLVYFSAMTAVVLIEDLDRPRFRDSAF